MSAFAGGSLGNYSNNELMEGYAKKVISHQGENGNLLISSKDRNGGTFAQPTTQPYNNFLIAKGFPIQQGQIRNIKLSEVRFPYAIPNINDYNNKMWVGVGGNFQQVIVDSGFYSGDALATKLNADLALLFPGSNPSFTYNADGTFTCEAFGYPNPLVPDYVSLYPSFAVGDDGAFNMLQPSTKPSLLSVMGFNFSPTQDYTTPATIQFSSVAPLVYTSFIDICSDVLTQYQDLPDAGTGQINRQHIICRLYVANETSTPSQLQSGNPAYPGQAPFVIHRQFKNPKVCKWNNQNSIDRIDIQLFDDAGRPLYLLPNIDYDDFQLTFQSAE